MYVQYIAQPVVRIGERLECGTARAFASAVDAEAVGAQLARHAVGVIVYELWGDPENEVWEEPEVLAVYGEVPPT